MYTYHVDVLAIKLLQKGLQALIIGLDANRAEDLLDVAGRRRRVAGKAEEKVSCQVLHF